MAIPPNSEVAPKKLLADTAGELDADIYLFQEVDHYQVRSGEINQMEEIAQARSKQYSNEQFFWRFAPTLIGTPGEKWRKTNSEESFVNSHICSYGIGMVSRTPIKEWRRIDLGKSIVGMPLLIPTARGVRPIYVRDEPRIAMAAITQSGWIIVNTHLSFVPFVNKFQLARLKRWAIALGQEFGIAKERIIIGGDLNLPAKWLVESKNWRSLVSAATYPSWQPKVQFDFFLGATGIKAARSEVRAHAGVSDHLAISIELTE